MNATVLPLNPPAPAPTTGECTPIIELGAHPSEAQLDAFWDGPGATSPIVEPAHPGHSSVTFLWRGDAHTNAVYVTLNRVTSSLEHAALRRLPGTDLWHRTYVLPDDWRTSYTMLAPTPKQHRQLCSATPRWAMRLIREHGHPDPRNPRQIHAHAGTMSEIALEHAQRCALLEPHHALATTHTTELTTPTGQRAWLLEPEAPEDVQFSADQEPEARPLIIMLDGEVWHTNGSVAHLLSALTTGGHPAPIALLLESAPGDRATEYGAESTYPDTIVNTILPWIRRIAPISHHPTDITLCGESLGGLTALRTALAHPQHVRNVIAQSSSLWATDLLPQVQPASTTTPQLNITLTVGSYETPMLAQHHQLNAALTQAGHHTTLTQYTGGHDLAWWVQLWGESVVSSHRVT